jgi:YD repeat-containing protein
VTKYSYDAYGRPLGVSIPNGQGVDVQQTWYYWDANPNAPTYSSWLAGRLAAVAFTRNEARYDFAYDELGRQVKKRLVVGETVIAEEQRGYDLEGRMVTTNHPDGNVYTYQYDVAGRLNGMKLGQTTLASVTGWTAAGQWTSWTHGACQRF